MHLCCNGCGVRDKSSNFLKNKITVFQPTTARH